MSKTIRIYRWREWKDLCEDHGVDPYEEVEFGLDEGGGNSQDFEYLGEIPDKEAK